MKVRARVSQDPVVEGTLKKHGSMTVTVKGNKATFGFANLDASRVDAVEKGILSVLGG